MGKDTIGKISFGASNVADWDDERQTISKESVGSFFIESKKMPVPDLAKPSEKKEKDWTVFDAHQAYSLFKIKPEETCDLRSINRKCLAFPGNGQRDHSCVGLAVATLLEWHFVKSGYLEEGEKVSYRYLWMAAKETDEIFSRPTSFIESEGTTIKAALDIARKYGVVTESFFPSDEKVFSGNASDFYARASNLRISSYYNLYDGLNNDDRFHVWMGWLVNIGPIIARVSIDSLWHQGLPAFGIDDCIRDEARGGHAVLIVGYERSGDFIIRNCQVPIDHRLSF